MDIQTGNAEVDGRDTRGWIVGSFMPDGDIRKTDNVEIKWGVHKKGTVRGEWVTDEVRTTVCILISGKFTLQFRGREVALQSPGDYVMWGKGIDHNWVVVDDCVTVTVRWPEGNDN